MSTLNVSNITDGTDTVETGYVLNGSAKVWYLYNGSGTPAFRDSFNSASITDHGTGDHSVNFTNNMDNANYSLSASAGNGNNADNATANVRRGVSSTSSMRNTTNYASSGTTALFDYNHISGSIHGDLA